MVITVIVLLILAGITIGALYGENGILNRAKQAKEIHEEATEEELRRLTQMEASMNTENHDYYDKNKDKAVIPAGFAVSQVEGENTIADGLVIIDKDGNEFVWIPCTEEEYKEAEDSWQKNETYINGQWSDLQSENIGIDSIKKYGGFYVARYEAGIPETATEIYASTQEGEFGSKRLQRNSKSVIEKYKPISQKGKQAWSSVSQTNAKILAEKMQNNNYVKSYLIDSYAWNAMCRVIEKNTDKSITDSNIWGNYSTNTTTNYQEIKTTFGIYYYNKDTSKWNIPDTINNGLISVIPKWNEIAVELTPGASEDFKGYNIYDIAGNMWEWTTEESTDERAVIRGGCLISNGAESPLVKYNGDNKKEGYFSWNIGFRCVLYIN